MDPSCCVPHREFSRLFLGEEPPVSKLNNVAALEIALTDEDHDANWRTQRAYALAALRYWRGHEDPASALRETLGKRETSSVSFATTREKKEGRPVLVAAVASSETEGLRLLRESAGSRNVDVLGLGQPYFGHETKLRLFKAWLDQQPESSMALLVDAYDVVLWPALSEFPKRFDDHFSNFDVVLGADATCYPDLALATFYGLKSERPFANSGTIAGSVKALRALFKVVFSYGASTLCGPDDQRAFHRAFLTQDQKLAIAIDSKGLLFHSLHRELRSLTVSAQGQLHITEEEETSPEDALRPCLTHGNAGDGRAAYEKVAEARRQALATAKNVSVDAALYMRGLELFKRGLTADAAIAWRQYLQQQDACDADYAADLRYNLGVLEDQAGRIDRALAYYESALDCAPNHVDALSNAGVAAYKLGNFSTAIGRLTRVLQLDPKDRYRKNLDVVLAAAASPSFPQ